MNNRQDEIIPRVITNEILNNDRVKMNWYLDDDIDLNDEEVKLLNQPLGRPMRSMTHKVIVNNINKKPVMNQSFNSFREDDYLVPIIVQKDEQRSSQIHFYRSKKS